MNKYQIAYQRFSKQVKALKEGKIRIVKRIASEARDEMKFQTTGQMYFTFGC